MRVGIVAFLQESNTFHREQTTLEHFEQDLLLRGEQVRRCMEKSHHEVAGFFAGLEEGGIEAVPVFAARAYPLGPIEPAAFERITEMMFAELIKAGDLDGVLTAPHGATVAVGETDPDGLWLSKVRQHLGPDKPIVCTLDPHANLSERMVKACDAMVAYRTNPHTDQFSCGLTAARIMVRTLRGEIRPTQAAVMPPVAINIEAQSHAHGPVKLLYDLADRQLDRKEVLSNSICLGYPYADVHQMGSAVIAVTDNNPTLARQLAGELAGHLWAHRADYQGHLVETDEALDRSADLEGPVCLLDMGDNIGGGSPADGTWLVEALMRRRWGPSFAAIRDPESVQQAEQAGVGKRVKLTVGGKVDERHGPQVTAEFTVIGLYDGKFEEPQPRHGGITHFDQGRTAVVRTDDDMTIMLTSRRMVPFSLQQITTFELDPTSFRWIVAKGVHAPVAAYAPVCKHFVRVDTPGVTSANMKRLDYERRRKPMYPFEPETPFVGQLFTTGHSRPATAR